MLQTQKLKKMRKVKTINGEILPLNEVKRFGTHGYYKIGDINIENSGECIQLENGQFYRLDTGLLIYDHTSKKYCLKGSNSKLVEGFIDNDLKIGYFQKRPNTIVIQTPQGYIHAISEDVLKGNYQYREVVSTGLYCDITTTTAFEFLVKTQVPQDYKRNLNYSIDLNNIDNVLNLRIGFFENDYITSTEILNIFKDFTFGYEFETVCGMIPPQKASISGLVPLRDGSISGLEYVTIPIQSEELVSTVKQCCENLKKYTTYDKNCSLHLHIGGVPRTESFILAYFKVIALIQDDMFKIFPLYKKEPYGHKQKNYSQPYPAVTLLSKLDVKIPKTEILKNFNHIFEYLSEGVPYKSYGENLNNVKNHPRDPDKRHKWQINTRYHWVNMIPLIFTNHSTIEFRLHNATFDFNKIMFFTLLNSLILKFTIQYEKNILEDPLFFHKINAYPGDDYLSAILSHQSSSMIAKDRSQLLRYFKNEKESYYNLIKNNNNFKDIDNTSVVFNITPKNTEGVKQKLCGEELLNELDVVNYFRIRAAEQPPIPEVVFPEIG